MGGWFLRRLLAAVPILFGITFVAFCLTALSPSDPAEVVIRAHMMVPTPELIEETRAELGLDAPFLVRYWRWLTAALAGDLGTSWLTGRPVAREILDALPATLALAAAAALMIAAASVAGGVLAARHEGRAVDRAIRAAIFVSGSVPAFWAGLLLMWLFSVRLGWLPTSGMEGFSSVILPASTLALAYIGFYTRLIRANLLEAKSRGFVAYCRAMGMPESRVTRHMLKNSLQSSVTALGMSIPKLIAGAFAVECIFAWPGLGRLAVASIFGRDFPVIQAYVLLMATLFLFFSLASDAANAALDPRTREED